MNIATFATRPRRVLVLCAASLLLHYLIIGWAGAHAGRSPQRVRAPGAIVARLYVAPPALPVRIVPPAPLVPEPVLARVAPKPAARERAGAPVMDALHAGRGAAEAASGIQSAPTAGAHAVAAPPRYKASAPPSANLKFEVARIDADGSVSNGEATMTWKVDGARYTVAFDAVIGMNGARMNLVTLASEGSVGTTGFAPLSATEKRRGRAPTATHFDYRQRRITFSAAQDASALLPGAQDKATLPLQLAAIARADAAQLGNDIEILVGEDKDASVFRFLVLGQEELGTRLGTMPTWHLSRPPEPGSYRPGLEIWLAPGHGWYPVRIRTTEANGAMTTQTVTEMAMTESEK
jgi:Protein of unknown function (DUF3108)